MDDLMEVLWLTAYGAVAVAKLSAEALCDYLTGGDQS